MEWTRLIKRHNWMHRAVKMKPVVSGTKFLFRIVEQRQRRRWISHQLDGASCGHFYGTSSTRRHLLCRRPRPVTKSTDLSVEHIFVCHLDRDRYRHTRPETYSWTYSTWKETKRPKSRPRKRSQYANDVTTPVIVSLFTGRWIALLLRRANGRNLCHAAPVLIIIIV